MEKCSNTCLKKALIPKLTVLDSFSKLRLPWRFYMEVGVSNSTFLHTSTSHLNSTNMIPTIVGVIHNDLKPENLLLCSKSRRDGTIKIIDFGCATISEPEMIFQQEVGDMDTDESGTVGYSPPERLNESFKLSPVVDTWAVGVIMYIMLTGGKVRECVRNCQFFENQ